ncbi:ferric reductase like transmembrane component-domain-containing protein [Phakopsora pachyrhizi]|nr:ferric reductase like transmembrane component-domain-containing protein [Phakopsora pachyrhizi]
MTIYLAGTIVAWLYGNTSDDKALFNFIRPGYIAASQIPFLFIFSMKNNPIGWIVGEGYERLNVYHGFLGRIIFGFSVIHGVNEFGLQNERGGIKIRGSVLYGLIALIALAAVLITSFKLFRDYFYQTFMITHILGYIIFLVMVVVHEGGTLIYVILGVIPLVIDGLMKTIRTKIRPAKFEAMPGGMTRISVQGLNSGWRAGQHVFIRVLRGKHYFEKHPFTIVNAASEMSPYNTCDHLLLVAKADGDFTKSIYRMADEINISQDGREKGVDSSPFRVLLEGPYGSFYEDMSQYDSVLLCSGGSGFAYCMGQLEAIVGLSVKGLRKVTKRIVVVWTLRNPELIYSFSNEIEEVVEIGTKCGIDIVVKIFFTSQDVKYPSDIVLANIGPELQACRPKLKEIVNEMIDTGNNGGLGIGICGPPGLVDHMRNVYRSLSKVQLEMAGGVSLHW